jgi:hypothetical protein
LASAPNVGPPKPSANKPEPLNGLRVRPARLAPGKAPSQFLTIPIRRIPNPDDRRSVVIEITPGGRATANQLPPASAPSSGTSCLPSPTTNGSAAVFEEVEHCRRGGGGDEDPGR